MRMIWQLSAFIIAAIIIYINTSCFGFVVVHIVIDIYVLKLVMAIVSWLSVWNHFSEL